MRGVPIGTWIRETIRQAPELVQTDESPESRSPAVWRHEHSKPRRPRLDRLKYLAINVFVAFHILGIACWCLPIDAPLIQVCRKLISPYFVWSGLFQSWDMFAPTPKGVNTYIEAVIVYRDGTRTSWTFLRMEF